MTIFSPKLHTFQLKRYCISLIILTIIWTHNTNAQINFINSQRYNIGQDWKRDANTTPITTPLKINLTFDPSLNQWSFPIQFGTPPQTMNIPIDMTYNLLWIVSELCISPFGDACNASRSINLFNTSLSNTTSSDYQEFTIKYINGSEFVAIWANDTIIINNQTFEQMAIGFPKDIKGNENVIIPDTTTGQIDLMPYQNYMLNNFADQTVGIAFSSTGGSITIGGIDSEYIIGNNVSNIAYQPLPQFTEPNQQFMINITNIYINNMPINISGLTWFNNEIQNIQLDDNSANILANLLSGGKYSSGVVIVDCNISSFDISFEIANQKLRLPSSIISTGKGGINGTNKCESIITGSANSTNSWIFGSAFITNFYMVFDQTKSQFGIASRSDIDYGPTPVEIMIQVPIYLAETKCLKIIDQNRISQAFSVDSIDQNGYYNVGGNYLAQEGFTYSFYFYPNSTFNATDCSGEQFYLAYTNPLKAEITKNPWEVTRSVYSVGLIIKMPSEALCLQINAFPVADDDNSPIYSSQFLVDNVEDNGYFHVKNYLVYQGLMYYFFAANNETGISNPCAVGFDHSRGYLSADITNDPWVVDPWTFNK